MSKEKSSVNWIQTILFCLLTVLFIAFAGFLIYNTWPHESENLRRLEKQVEKLMQQRFNCQTITETIKTTNEVPVFKPFCFNLRGENIVLKSTTETTKTKDGVRQYTISQEELNTVLQTVAYSARKEAADEYKNNLSILLTILTIFGIAWPVIMVLLQSQSFKEDKESLVNKYEESSKQYHDQIDKVKQDLDMEFQRKMKATYLEFADNCLANEWFWNFEIKNYTDQIKLKQAEIETANEENKLRLISEKEKLENSRSVITKNRAKTLMKIIYYDALAGKISRADSKVDTLMDVLNMIQGWIDNKKTVKARTVKEIDWELFRQTNVRDKDIIEVKFRNIFCLSWEEDSESNNEEGSI
ncbi:MAG: hypothetical protein J5806_01795 [Lentisphaeria bacterium]|nr:hypothetical protein [Lentisphaeria bacterium]